STGALIHGFIFINFDSRPERNPSIAMDAAGNAVVAYQELLGIHSIIAANRLRSDGSVGGAIVVAESEDINDFNASVALAPSGGQFAVAYVSAQLSGISAGVRVVEVAANDTVSHFGQPPEAGPFDGSSPAASIDGFGRYVVSYERRNPATNRVDIFSRRFFLT